MRSWCYFLRCKLSLCQLELARLLIFSLLRKISLWLFLGYHLLFVCLFILKQNMLLLSTQEFNSWIPSLGMWDLLLRNYKLDLFGSGLLYLFYNTYISGGHCRLRFAMEQIFYFHAFLISHNGCSFGIINFCLILTSCFTVFRAEEYFSRGYVCCIGSLYCNHRFRRLCLEFSWSRTWWVTSALDGLRWQNYKLLYRTGWLCFSVTSACVRICALQFHIFVLE